MKWYGLPKHRDHLFKTYEKFSEKLIFLTLVCVSEKFLYVLNGWSHKSQIIYFKANNAHVEQTMKAEVAKYDSKNHKISNSGELAENGPKTSYWGLPASQNSKIHQFLLEILLIKISCNLIGKTIWKIKNPF